MNLFGVGPTEIVVVLIVILVLFGPDKLPELAKKIGGASRELREGLNSITEQMNTALETSMEMEKAQMLKPAADAAAPTETQTIAPPAETTSASETASDAAAAQTTAVVTASEAVTTPAPLAAETASDAAAETTSASETASETVAAQTTADANPPPS